MIQSIIQEDGRFSPSDRFTESAHPGSATGYERLHRESLDDVEELLRQADPA
jgi:hypothetical protein